MDARSTLKLAGQRSHCPVTLKQIRNSLESNNLDFWQKRSKIGRPIILFLVIDRYQSGNFGKMTSLFPTNIISVVTADEWSERSEHYA